MNLRSVDLNLLTIFHAIYVEKNVSQAAKQLCMSQSAVSAALSRLGILFDDELFLRTASGVQPTDKADELASPVTEILEKIEDTLTGGDDFDFSKLKRRFTLAMSDYGEQLILPKLMWWLEKNAPEVDVVVLPLNEDSLIQDCSEGKVDLAIGYLPFLSTGFYCQTLLKDSFVSVVRKDHPVLKNSWNLEAFLSLSHISVNFRGQKGTSIDLALESEKLKRRCVLRVPNFRSILSAVKVTDYAGDLPLLLAQHVSESDAICILQPPLNTQDTEICQFWHERVNKNVAHRWFRGVVYSLIAQEL